jgi:hypothetical protein
MPVYLSFADLETAVGGPDSLKLIADPTFTNDTADADLVDDALDFAEAELLRYCRAAPVASGLATWLDTPAALPQQARAAIITLAVYRLHELIRGTQGVAIPSGSIKSKDAIYASFDGLASGLVSWVNSSTPAQSLTQKVRVYTDSAGGRRATAGQVRKLIG